MSNEMKDWLADFEVCDISTFDLYAEVRYINAELMSDDQMHPLSWTRIDELQERKSELVEEINRRDNERFR